MTAFAEVTALSAYVDAVAGVRRRAGAYTTNLFVDPAAVERWILGGALRHAELEGTSLFLRRDRWFQHLYVSAPDPEALAAALARPEVAREGLLTVDLLGSQAAAGQLAVPFAANGFKPYATLRRMVRVAGAQGASEEASPAGTAAPEDVDAILGLLEASFDPLKEQLPSREDVASAVGAGQVLVARSGEALGGLLFFETTGLTSTLRYWLVAPGHRDRGIGAKLMRDYYRRCPAVKRFLLWVIDSNGDAITKYHHYGYSPDGLHDLVMITEGNPQ